MFGQPSFGGFGQAQSQPAFGATTQSSPFGGGAFGSSSAQPQQPSPFGAAAPAFGAAASTPAFGAPQSQGGMFGGSAFGAKPGGGFSFGGAAAPSPFGAPSQPAFGAAASTPAFGGFGAASTPAFGAPAASTPAFGAPAAASMPAFGGFGAASTPAFGAPASATPAFGTPGSAGATPSPFGAAPGSAFGAPATGFGAPAAAVQQQQQNMGSRIAPYQKHQDKDTSSSSSTAPTTVYYSSISAMPQYQNKSVEELRWEDYQAGVKNQSSAPPPAAAPAAGGAFGAPAAGGFGGFGATTGAFGAPAAAGGGVFGAASAPSPFGASSTPAFGASSPAPFGGFGASTPASTPAFGGFGAASQPATSTGLFGAASQPAASAGFSFGGSTPAFGAASSAPAFGAAATPSVFGGTAFGASSGGLFGASSTPAFGAPSSSPFGASTPAFGTPGASPFGAASTPAPSAGFGASGFSFGTPGSAGAKPGGFAFGQSSGGLFGAPASTGSLFGGSSAPAFGSTGGLFGSTPASQPAAGTSLFGGSAFGAAPAGGGLFGAPAQSQPAAGAFSFAPQQAAGTPGAGQVALPGVAQQPYGALQPLPQVNVPEHKVGISQRSVRQAVTSMRPSPLLTLRSNTPKFGLGTGALSRGGGSSGNLAAGSSSPYALSGGVSPAGDGRSGSPAAALLLPARDNPHRLFIRSPPPSTTPAANGSSISPVRSSRTPTAPGSAAGDAAGGDREQTPARTPPAYKPSPSPGESPATNGLSGGKPGEAGQADAAAAAGSSGKAGAADADAGGGIAPRLGSLRVEGYALEPPEAELQALARSNPGTLARLAGFKVVRPGYGSLEWLQPVDVRELQLQDIVQIERGEVSVYINAPEAKPPIGSGLNAPCRVVLTGVFKKAKPGAVAQDDVAAAAAAAAFRKRLQRYCSDMGARFISYQLDGGVWTFEVEHFSRYAAPMDAEDSDEELDQEQQEPEPALGRQGFGKGAPGFDALEEQDEDEELAGKGLSQEAELTFGGVPGDSDHDMPAAAAGGDGDDDVTQQRRSLFRSTADDDEAMGSEDAEPGERPEPGGGRGLPGLPLQHALPALLGHDAGALLELRGAFFRRGGAAAASGVDAPPFLSAGAVGDSAADAAASPAPAPGSEGGWGLEGRAGFDSSSVALQLSRQPQHNWVRQRAPLLQPPGSERQPRQQQLALLAAPQAGGPQSPQQLAEAAAPATPPPSSLLVSPLTPRALLLQQRQQSRPGAMALDAAGAQQLLPAGDAVAASGAVVDASLMLGRSFRVGWGPGGMLAVPANPLLDDTAAGGDAKATGARAQDAGRPCVELRQLQPIAAVALPDSGSTGAAGAADSSAAVAAMRERVLGALELHLQHSSLAAAAAAGARQGAATADAAMDHDSGAAAGAAAAAADACPQWQLRCDRRQLGSFVEQQVACSDAAAATAGADGSGGGAAADASGCGQQVRQLWQLLLVLYAHIEGEDDSSSGSGSTAAGDVDGSSGSREQLAAMQRKAALSQWLQAKLKPQVVAALRALQDDGSGRGGGERDGALWGLLQLMSGRQVGAAVALAVAIGDSHLATLLAAAGQAVSAAGGQNVVQQVQAWTRAGVLPGHISTPRRLLLALLAASAPAAGSAGGPEGLMDVAAALHLDWSRAFGLWLWYGVPFTEPVASVTTAYTAALAASSRLARPMPPHAGDACILLQPRSQQAGASGDASAGSSTRALVPAGGGGSAAGVGAAAQAAEAGRVAAAADTQYALLQLHARGCYGLAQALLNTPGPGQAGSSSPAGTVDTLLAQLLRVAGHTTNPLDYSTAWQLLAVLEAVGALPPRREEYEATALAVASSLICQLMLLGPAAAHWAVFVALSIPDSLLLPGCRAAAIQQLLQVTAPHWAAQPHVAGWLRDELALPPAWLHEAQAAWCGYTGRPALQLLHLLAAGSWQRAHDLACCEVAPMLALAVAAARLPGGGSHTSKQQLSGRAWGVGPERASAATADAAAAFAADAAAFLASVGRSAADTAAPDAAGGRARWRDTLQQDAAAGAVAAASYVAAAATVAAAGNGGSGAMDGGGAELAAPARLAGVALRALCAVLSELRGLLGPPWQLGGGVYAAWCAAFLDADGGVSDPAAAAAAAGATAAGDAAERCLHLADLLAGVAAAGGGSGDASSWWCSAAQRLVQARMTADAGRALVRLGSASGQGRPHAAALLAPLAASGGAGDASGGGRVAQLLSGAAASVAAASSGLRV